MDGFQRFQVCDYERNVFPRDPGDGPQNDLGAYPGGVAYRYGNAAEIYIFTSM